MDDFQVDLILMTDIRGPDRGFVSPPVPTFTSLLLLLLLLQLSFSCLGLNPVWWVDRLPLILPGIPGPLSFLVIDCACDFCTLYTLIPSFLLTVYNHISRWDGGGG